MPYPLAIYASIPGDTALKPLWQNDPAFSLPVIFERPNANWPDLNWCGNFWDDAAPLAYGLEIPQYLWSAPMVAQPELEQTHIFCRKWSACGNQFSAAVIPEGNYLAVLTHAADDQYQVYLRIEGALQHPIGGNSFLPNHSSWRNVKTFVYRIPLRADSEMALTSVVTNNPQPGGTSESNPAMFTWVMQIFDLHKL
jgi:hypothetical protein